MKDKVKQAAAKRRWRKNNPMKDAESMRLYRSRRRALIDSFKARPCVDCEGRFPPECMDFDHVRGEKLFTIGDRSGRALEAILDEIEKCDVVCSN